MQHERPAPPSAYGAPQSVAGSAMGGGSHYAPPSVGGYGPMEMYDDGASIAGSQLTFMDGAVGGRTSQYGLPKYRHQVKPDYRRWV